MAYTADDFKPAIYYPGNLCGCDEKGYMACCEILYEDEKKHRHRVCFRQQCTACGFVRKNRMGRNMYFQIVDSNSKDDMYVFLPEYFWAPDEYMYDENHQFDKKKKLDFIRRILTLANRNQNYHGNLTFTKEEIENLKIA